MRSHVRRHVTKKAQINITYLLEHIERVDLDQDEPATILDA